MHKVLFQSVFLENISCGRVDLAAGYSGLYRCDTGRLRFLDRLIPPANALRCPTQIHRTRHIAAIVAEYNTQVQHDQLIFPQALGGGSRMRQRGSASPKRRSFRRRGHWRPLPHLILDLSADLRLADARPDQLHRTLQGLPPPEWPPCALRPVLPRSLRLRRSSTTPGASMPLQLAPAALRTVFHCETVSCPGIKSKPSNAFATQQFSQRGVQSRALLQFNFDAACFVPCLDREAAIGQQVCFRCR